MTNLLSLLMVIGVFMSMTVLVAYVADIVACKLVSWMNTLVINVEE